jgi:heat shock protein HtpX
MMAAADSFRRLTRAISLLVFFYLFFAFPMIMTGSHGVSLTALMLILASPLVSLLLELALSRTREFEADRMTLELTGDPEGFISALEKLDHRNLRLWKLVFGSAERESARSSDLLRTHPSLDERLRRIREVSRGAALYSHR